MKTKCFTPGAPTGDDIRDCYMRNHHPNLMRVLAESAESLKNRNFESCLKIVSGDHQRCVSNEKKNAVAKAIHSNLDVLQALADFESLFGAVSGVLKEAGVKNVPSLWTYDIAIKIGQSCNPKIEPNDFVYLFRGAAEGAKKLLKVSKIPDCIKRTDITERLGELSALDCENLLCICKECIEHGKPTPNKHCNN